MHMKSIEICFLELEGNSSLKSCLCKLLAGKKKVKIQYLSLVEPCQQKGWNFMCLEFSSYKQYCCFCFCFGFSVCCISKTNCTWKRVVGGSFKFWKKQFGSNFIHMLQFFY